MKISDVRTDGGTQPRKELDYEVIEEYRSAMESGSKFPDITVFFDGIEYWLADGFHRIEAAKKLGKKEVNAEIIKGTLRDAVLFSVGVNFNHGLRRTNDDKRRAVMVLLNDPEWSQWSDSEIARRCNVAQSMVSNHRKKISLISEISENPATEITEKKYINKHGQEATMKTENIGKNQPLINQPQTHLKFVPKTPEEREAVEHGVTFNAEVFTRICRKQIDRIEKSDPTAIESLKNLMSYIEKTIEQLENNV